MKIRGTKLLEIILKNAIAERKYQAKEARREKKEERRGELQEQNGRVLFNRFPIFFSWIDELKCLRSDNFEMKRNLNCESFKGTVYIYRKTREWEMSRIFEFTLTYPGVGPKTHGHACWISKRPCFSYLFQFPHLFSSSSNFGCVKLIFLFI